MAGIESKLIRGVVANEIRNQKFRKQANQPYATEVSFMVMETKIDGLVYYCCLSGGTIDRPNKGPITIDSIRLTEIGTAALEVLINLPVGNNKTIIFQGIGVGETPLGDKVIQALRRHPAGSKVCFIGDMAGELDGIILQAFNLVGTIVLSV